MARLYAGQQLRALRLSAGLNQRAMAARLGLSVSYLSQLETGERPLTAAVTTALARHYPQALAAIEGEAPARRLAALGEALADPAVAPLDADEAARLAEERPEIADRLIALHAAKRAAEERLAIAEESMTAGTGARLPWEAVRDWFHEAGNYVDPLDRAAEELAELAAADWGAALAGHGIALAVDADEDAPLARFDGATLTLKAALPPESRRFLIAHRLAATAFAREIESIVAGADVPGAEARRLLAVGLANYAAGALVMPYAAFRAEARRLRHDIDRLSRRFAVSFEQACHRLSTLQRTGADGVPFYFCRVDMAGHPPAIRALRRGLPAVACSRGGRDPRPHPRPARRDAGRRALYLDGEGAGETLRQLRARAPALCRGARLRGDARRRFRLCRRGGPHPRAHTDRHLLPPVPARRLRPARLPADRPRDRGGTFGAQGGALSGGVRG